MAVMGLGTDIVQIDRLELQLSKSDKLAKRVLTEREFAQFEQHNYPARFLAKRFAAKEAVAKALGTGIGRGVSWQHMEITRNTDGRPLMQLTGGARQKADQMNVASVHLSYSDEREYVVAFAVLDVA